MITFYYASHTCAIGIRILLEEAEADFTGVKLDAKAGALHKPPFSDINPKGKVPVIVREDGSVLTEFGAIAGWIAAAHPQATLLAEDERTHARAVEMLDYVVGTIHGQGFRRIFRPQSVALRDADHDAVRAIGREMVEQAFRIVAGGLGEREFVTGRFGIADAALFYTEWWATQERLPMPASLEAHYQRVLARPSVQRALPDFAG